MAFLETGASGFNPIAEPTAAAIPIKAAFQLQL
jgi:hypothetical protein